MGAVSICASFPRKTVNMFYESNATIRSYMQRCWVKPRWYAQRKACVRHFFIKPLEKVLRLVSIVAPLPSRVCFMFQCERSCASTKRTIWGTRSERCKRGWLNSWCGVSLSSSGAGWKASRDLRSSLNSKVLTNCQSYSLDKRSRN